MGGGYPVSSWFGVGAEVRWLRTSGDTSVGETKLSLLSFGGYVYLGNFCPKRNARMDVRVFATLGAYGHRATVEIADQSESFFIKASGAAQLGLLLPLSNRLGLLTTATFDSLNKLSLMAALSVGLPVGH